MKAVRAEIGVVPDLVIRSPLLVGHLQKRPTTRSAAAGSTRGPSGFGLHTSCPGSVDRPHRTPNGTPDPARLRSTNCCERSFDRWQEAGENFRAAAQAPAPGSLPLHPGEVRVEYSCRLPWILKTICNYTLLPRTSDTTGVQRSNQTVAVCIDMKIGICKA